MTTNQSNYVPYSDAVEVKQPNEDEQTRQVVDSMARVNRLMFEKHRHAIRDAHAKSHGILRGELQIYDNLPQPLAQGLFKTPATYPIIVRLSTAPGAIMPDGQPTFRGMAIKVIGVEGPKFLPDQADALTQDFLLVNHPIIPTGTVEAYLKQQLKLEKQAGLPEELQEAQSKLITSVHKLLDVVGLEPEPNDLGIGKANTHILGETFFSMAALRYGDYIAKLSAVPLSEALQPLRGQEIDARNDSALRDLVVSFFVNQGAEYELRAQLCTDLTRMPVEDGSVEWPQDQSPYQPIGKLVIPAQNAYSPARRVYADDVLTFNPFHCLPDHRPLGSIMRARQLAYETSSQYRHQMNAQPRIEPRSIDELPD
ncbi:catalase family protein [Spirosoma pollinicola]|uniref:Catalase n=1 Tax=Spirosoma pollinicola TaxID=2057025 RepID=A0A2K8Z2H1_9BACT|nr:catalase family protein [Spirosoma pollinicola]AUD04073.1 catalase [Spirosoma pollinicola]